MTPISDLCSARDQEVLDLNITGSSLVILRGTGTLKEAVNNPFENVDVCRIYLLKLLTNISI